MKDEFTNFDEIDKWFNGKLSQEEKINFERRLTEDSDFAGEVQMFKDMTQSISLTGERETRKSLTAMDAQLDTEGFFNEKTNIKTMNTNNKSFIRLLAVAASIAIVVGALFFMMGDNSINPKEAYATYFKPETKILPSILDRLEASGLGNPEKPTEDSLANALKFYEQQKYEDARVALDTYLKSHPEDQVAKFYMGVSLMQQSEYAKAAGHLLPLTKDKTSVNHNAAKWYLALCYTMFDTPTGLENAKKLMKGLQNNLDSGYAKEAKEYRQLMGWK